MRPEPERRGSGFLCYLAMPSGYGQTAAPVPLQIALICLRLLKYFDKLARLLSKQPWLSGQSSLRLSTGMDCQCLGGMVVLAACWMIAVQNL